MEIAQGNSTKIALRLLRRGATGGEKALAPAHPHARPRACTSRPRGSVSRQDRRRSSCRRQNTKKSSRDGLEPVWKSPMRRGRRAAPPLADQTLGHPSAWSLKIAAGLKSWRQGSTTLDDMRGLASPHLRPPDTAGLESFLLLWPFAHGSDLQLWLLPKTVLTSPVVRAASSIQRPQSQRVRERARIAPVADPLPIAILLALLAPWRSSGHSTALGLPASVLCCQP